MWILQSLSPDLSLLFRVMPCSTKTVGRAPRADFIVDAALVSRLHCRLTLDDAGRLDVEDLGSTNGTWVNGRKVERAPLAAGDTIRIGRVEFRVVRPAIHAGTADAVPSAT
jgi:pSer/pThr/pTyr-binding forkhead associated (FHA) protein